jgi:cytochrome oxidase Cu insertion factor (SCO1/SenC/PrrC family)
MKHLHPHRILLQAAIWALTLLPFGLHAQSPAGPELVQLGDMQIPNIELQNQHGETVRIYDLIRGKTVAISFIFTTCTTICPPMGANFSKVKSLLGDAVGKEVAMLSISLDPVTDTPARLLEWQEKFGDAAGWTMLTGKKPQVDRLLKALKVYTPLKEDHAPIVVLGRDRAPNWTRTNGLADPNTLADLIRAYLPTTGASTGSTQPDAERDYFGDTRLVDQNGEGHRFYSDLLKGKTVVINAFFTECTGTCPVMSAAMREIQDHFGARMGKDVVVLSISVDSRNDTPEVMKAYADRFGAGPGWYFLSGQKSDVDAVLAKLGQATEFREGHKTVFLVGNVPTRLWKKVDGMSKPEEIIALVEKVLHDQQ